MLIPLNLARMQQSVRIHSITSSAIATSDGGFGRPRAFAVFLLIASRHLVGACTEGRQVFAFEDAVDVVGGASVNVDGVRSVGNQTPSKRKVWKRIYRRPPTISLEQVKGFSLWVLRPVMSGRGDEVVDLTKTYLLPR
jgi:hypothetical protein